MTTLQNKKLSYTNSVVASCPRCKLLSLLRCPDCNQSDNLMITDADNERTVACSCGMEAEVIECECGYDIESRFFSYFVPKELFKESCEMKKKLDKSQLTKQEKDRYESILFVLEAKEFTDPIFEKMLQERDRKEGMQGLIGLLIVLALIICAGWWIYSAVS